MITERFIPLADAVMAGRGRTGHPRVVLPAGTDHAGEAELAAMADHIVAELFPPPHPAR